jgi:hypothetical protein
MNVEIASQLESPLVQSLQSALVSEPFNYKLDKNFPILSKLRVDVHPETLAQASSTDAHGYSLSFKVPRYGLLMGMAIRSTINTSATKTNTLTRLDTLGSRIFSNVSLRSHSRVIQDNPSFEILSRVLESSQEQFNAYQNMMTGVPAVNNNVTNSVLYTPLFFYFGEKSHNFLDTTFSEPLEVVATVNSQSGVWGTDEILSTFGFSSCVLEVYYIQLESKVHQSLIASQFPQSSNLTMLANDAYLESPTIFTYASGTTATIEHEVKSKNVVHSCHIYARNKNTNALLPIDSVTMTAGGQQIVNSARRSQIFENQSNKFIFNVPGSSTGTNSYMLYFGLDSDKTYLSGVNALQSLNNPIISAVVDTSSGVSAADIIELVVVWQYATLLSIDSSNGAVQRSLVN